MIGTGPSAVHHQDLDPTGERPRTRVVVCGTRFGQVYLEAFRDPDLPFELAGIVAHGSERSRACAEHYGVPLFTGVDQIPADVRIACVVIRSGLLGGRGSELAQELLARGINVIQEHPLHRDELARCLKLARRHGVGYHLNSFYLHTRPVREFVAAARELLARQPAMYIDASCGFQLAYSLLDILGEVLGGVRPWAFTPAPALPPEVRAATGSVIPFRSLDGVLGGVPITLRVQNQLDPEDPDNYAHLMHRISIGTEAGNLTLVGTHGPIVWSARPDFPREVTEVNTDPHFDTAGPGAGPDSGPLSSITLGSGDVASFEELFATVWPAGVGRALTVMQQDVDAGADPLRRGQRHLTVCELWQDVSLILGPPELLSAERPRALDQEGLDALRAAVLVDAVRAGPTRDWLRWFAPRPHARLRLVCFPHASGNAAFYRSWARALPDDVELVAVQYPGRLDRFSEPRVERMDEMVAALTGAVRPLLSSPLAFFGHSMGASVAYEVALALEARLDLTLEWLAVSGKPAPRHHRPGRKHLAGDDTLWGELVRLGGTDEAVLNHPELKAALLPALRSDYRLIETYQPVAGPPLRSPVVAFGGDDDPEAPLPLVADWAECSTGGFELATFPGGHFYLIPQERPVLARLARLSAVAERSP